ncbi:hypothetical protein [Pseudoalteromonas sp. P1-7a]|uniref:hypothetical protein n=1 Tax=Pseudoalteromonas sp. P1-7a TaxID=1723755 RepID=UPI0006D66E78|nr:hypothetical protein [Pseudoalteromonas sp. P1-7a]KPZ59536.1 hypothetical protein AN389_02682 [Pseudoalteromonas sp. P1-7a]
MDKSQENHYYIMTEKHKLISDETAKVRSQIMYFSTICLIFIYLKGKSLTSIFGMKFSEDVSIPINNVLVFMFFSIAYTLVHFIFRVKEDIKAFSFESFDKDSIKSQVIRLPNLKDYVPVQPAQYEEIFAKYHKAFLEIVRDIELTEASEIRADLECYSRQQEILKQVENAVNQNFEGLCGQAKAELSVNISDFANSAKNGLDWGTKIFSLEREINKSIGALQKEIQLVHNINHDKELITRNFKSEIEKIEESIDLLMNEVSKRAANHKLEKFFNIFIPYTYGVSIISTLLYIYRSGI